MKTKKKAKTKKLARAGCKALTEADKQLVAELWQKFVRTAPVEGLFWGEEMIRSRAAAVVVGHYQQTQGGGLSPRERQDLHDSLGTATKQGGMPAEEMTTVLVTLATEKYNQLLGSSRPLSPEEIQGLHKALTTTERPTAVSTGTPCF